MDCKKDKAKERLNNFISQEVTTMFSNILDFTEVAVGDRDRHKALRSKVLKISNDTIRSIQKEVCDRYSLKFIPPVKDIIVVKKR